MPLLRYLILTLTMLMSQGASAASADGAVGMVLDLQGSGQIREKGEISKLQLLAYLKPQMRIMLDAGSKTSLSLYATRTVYQLTGPAIVEIGKDRLNLIEGKAPVSKSMAEKLVVAAENTKVIPGAYRMRSFTPKIVIVTPENGSVLLDKRPMFSWAAVDSASYDIVVKDDADKPVASAKVTGTSWQLPTDTVLADGQLYRWTLSYASADDGKIHSITGHFSIASQIDADRLAALKPAEGAAIEEWILYAAMLQNRRMLPEARLVWQKIVKQRPDLEKVQELAQ